MAGPITWRNVATGGGNAAGLLAAGQQQVQQGFETLRGLFKDNTAEDRQNFAATRDFNTQAYLDKVAATDLAALASPVVQQQLAADRAAYGVGIDQAATRNAIQARLADAQKAAVQQGQYDDFQQARKERVITDQLYGMAAAGDKAGVDKILQEQQLLNEGELRKQLTGTFDDAQQREYRAAAEGRAQRADARSAASHALSQAQGYENLNYAKAVHSEGIRKLNEDKLADSLAMRVYEEDKNATQAQNSLIEQIAKENGTTVGVDGTIDLKSLDQDAQDRITNQLRESGTGGNTATASRQRLLNEAKAQGMSAAGIQQVLARYDTVKQFDGLAPEDQAKVEREVASAVKPITNTQERLTSEFNRKSKDNPFLAPPQDTTKEANDLVAYAAKEFDGQWTATDVNQASLAKAAVNLMQNGLSVTLDGKDVDVVVPPSLIKRAITEVGANKFSSEGPEVKAAITRYLKEDKGLQRQAVEAQSLTETFQKDMADLSTKKFQAENQVLRARTKEKGVTVSSNDWVDAVLRRKSSGN